jgi:hypothetical protein
VERLTFMESNNAALIHVLWECVNAMTEADIDCAVLRLFESGDRVGSLVEYQGEFPIGDSAAWRRLVDQLAAVRRTDPAAEVRLLIYPALNFSRIPVARLEVVPNG